MRLHQRIRRQQARQTDDWLITYADTITLLLCLFVIMLSVRTGTNGLAHEAPTPSVQPAAFDVIFGGHSPFPAASCETRPVLGTPPEPAPAPIRSVAEPAPPPPLATITPAPEARPVSLPAIMDSLTSHGTAAVERQGDRITALRIGSAAFFASGTATLSAAGKTLLGDVAITLKSDAFAAYRINIEGHTDDTPIETGRFQSNWELSTARAAAVVRFLLDQGIPARRLTAAGYADTFPIAPNRNADGSVIPENQARNRRVVIRLEKIDKADR